MDTREEADIRYCFDCRKYRTLGDDLAYCEVRDVFFHLGLSDPQPGEGALGDATTCAYYRE